MVVSTHGVMGHWTLMVDPLRYVLVHSVFHYWYNKNHGSYHTVSTWFIYRIYFAANQKN